MRAALIIGAAFLMFGCKRTAEPEYASYGRAALDCKKGFEALVAELDNARGLVVDRHSRGSNAYRDDRTDSLYIVTLPDHPAHPAIFLRQVVPTTEVMIITSNGCGFGDRDAFEREMRRYHVFDDLLNAEEQCYLCSENRLTSPSVDARRTPPPPPPIDTDNPA